MANPANDYGKVQKDSRKTGAFDNESQAQELENIDLFNNFWAKITARSTDYYDQYTVDIYPDEKLIATPIASGCMAFSVDLHRYAVNEIVRVYWRPATQFALIFSRSLFAWIKVTQDWAPNQSIIKGKRCTQAGVLLELQDPEVQVSLTGSNLPVVYCPFKKDNVVCYFRWPFDIPTSWSPIVGSSDGVILNFPQVPMPTALHQVLICVGAEGIDTGSPKFRVAFGPLRTMDRLNAPNDNTPNLLE